MELQITLLSKDDYQNNRLFKISLHWCVNWRSGIECRVKINSLLKFSFFLYLNPFSFHSLYFTFILEWNRLSQRINLLALSSASVPTEAVLFLDTVLYSISPAVTARDQGQTLATKTARLARAIVACRLDIDWPTLSFPWAHAGKASGFGIQRFRWRGVTETWPSFAPCNSTPQVILHD